MSTIIRPFFPPDRSDRHSELATSIARAATAMARAVFSDGFVTDAKTSDPVAQKIILRGAVAPFSTATDTALSQTVISTLAAIIGPQPAIGRLIPLMFNVDPGEGLYGVQVPSVNDDPDAVAWVGEGKPIPVRSSSFAAGATLTPKKMGTIATLTRETVEHTNAETVIRELLKRNLARGLEKFLFGTDAASASQPAGLLKDVTPTGATAGGGDNALITDLGNIGAAVATVASDIFYVAGPAAGVKISIRAPFFKFPLAISTAVADDTVICLSPSCVAIVGGNDPPKLDVSAQAVLHMDDAPLPLTTAATASFPIRSMFSTDCVAIRLRADLDWALRNASAIAVVNSITW